MDFYSVIMESFGTLGVNKLRTALAMLGIVIGIASVIALISLGQSTEASIQSQIQSLGSNLLTVQPGGSNTGAVRGAAGGGTTLTLDDATAIQSTETNLISTVSPELTRRTQITTGKTNTNTQVIGSVPSYTEVHKITIDIGSFFTDKDVTSAAKVAVIGPQVVTDLFNGDQSAAMGSTIRINSQSFTIVGITASKGGTGFQNQDDIVYVPLTSAQKIIFGVSYLSSIGLEAKSADLMTDASNAVGYLLLERHKLKDPSVADFSIFSQQDILNTASSSTASFTTLLSGVAAISLLVGGIGIMNIMLVTVTERTREIGLRKALGARKGTIILQFLTESVILTFIGGAIGILLGVLLSYIILTSTSAPFILDPISIILSFVVSVTIGIVFGAYPARRAANLQPIEALRYE